MEPKSPLDPLEPWQEKVLKKFQGKGYTQITGRQYGKSYNVQAMQRLMDDLLDKPIEDLLVSTGTVFGKRYFTIEPVGGNWLAMEQWCIDTFGPSASVWQTFKESDTLGRWYVNDRRFWFLEEKDKDWFLLRWSSS
jgi:hypothetical protein